MVSPLPVAQFRPREAIIDLGWGHPHPAALPGEEWAQAYAAALRRHGPAALTYGSNAGPGPLIEWLCDRLGHTDVRQPTPAEVFVTAGASAALELIASALVRPGDAVLVDSPTYHLALRILADHSTDLVPAPADGDGIDPAATRQLIDRLQREGRRVPVLYLVPTFANPTGRSLPAERRAALVEIAARTGVTIIEDDTYRELGYDRAAPPSLYAAAGDAPVVRVGSFAKTVGPGLRLGYLTAAAPLVRDLADRGFVDSGGGLNHTTALAMAEFGTGGAYARHVKAIRARYAAQRDRLTAAARDHLPAAAFATPAGGWFLWLRLPPGERATGLLPRAEAAGVSFVPGPRFFVAGRNVPDIAGGEDHIRLSYSMLDGDQLAEGARRLAEALAHPGRD